MQFVTIQRLTPVIGVSTMRKWREIWILKINNLQASYLEARGCRPKNMANSDSRLSINDLRSAIAKRKSSIS
jgi:hypothetical protein